jgi:hypothetical protein
VAFSSRKSHPSQRSKSLLAFRKCSKTGRRECATGGLRVLNFLADLFIVPDVNALPSRMRRAHLAGVRQRRWIFFWYINWSAR